MSITMAAAILAFLGVLVSLSSVLVGLMKLGRLVVPEEREAPPATLVLPLTGMQPALPDLIARLNRQTGTIRRLLIAVESPADPAFEAARQAIAGAGFPCEVIVAGPALTGGQKCRNQRAALAALDQEDAILVMMDGDIAPQPSWLSALVAPLARGDFDLVTGNRWQRIAAPALGPHLVAAIDRAVTSIPRIDMAFAATLWGGSIAMRRETLERLDIDAALQGTLSDDFTIAARAHEERLAMATRSGLLIASPNAQSLGAAFRFGQRQYRICHIYRPWLWRIAFAVIHLRLAAWLAAIWLGITLGGLAWSLAAALSLLGLAKQATIAKIAARAEMPDPPRVRAVQLALGVVQFLPDLFHAAILVGSLRTRRIRWGHVVYRVEGPDAIKVEERLPFSS